MCPLPGEIWEKNDRTPIVIKRNCVSNHPSSELGQDHAPDEIVFHLEGTRPKRHSTCIVLPALASRRCGVEQDAGTDWRDVGTSMYSHSYHTLLEGSRVSVNSPTSLPTCKSADLAHLTYSDT